MQLFKRTTDIEAYLLRARAQYRSVGFVPTMGALHAGHLALLQQSKARNQLTICSIFVNPTQFNDAADLEKYPRTPAKDVTLLAKVGCDTVFLPGTEDVYPPDQPPIPAVDLAGLDEPMEGAFRPGHFAGVAQVVRRFIAIVRPDYLYLGQKDYQQFRIVQHMIEQAALDVKPIMVPTVRETDGLALSSRNVRLTPEHRRAAPLLNRVLLEAETRLKQGEAPANITDWAMQALAEPTGFRPEYFTLADANTLQPVTNPAPRQPIVACTAVWAGAVRLIDNRVVHGKV